MTKTEYHTKLCPKLLKKDLTKELTYDTIIERNKYGSLVKRLRHGPLKAEPGVRFSHESPKQKGHRIGVLFVLATPGRTNSAPQGKRGGAEFESLPRRFRVGSLARRGRVSHEFAAQGRFRKCEGEAL